MKTIPLYNHRTRSIYNLNLEKWIEPFNDGSEFYQNWCLHLMKAYEQIEYRKLNSPLDFANDFEYVIFYFLM